MAYLMLSEENQFKFVCPIFNAPTKMSSCVKLRNMVWMGKKPEKRKGCQACMHAGKCPAAVVVQKMAMSNPTRPVPDVYASTVEVDGKLDYELLARIQPVSVTQSVLSRYSLTGSELNAIETANERIAKMMGVAPQQAKSVAPSKPKKRKAAPKTAPDNTKINQAAATGDLSAALEKD